MGGAKQEVTKAQANLIFDVIRNALSQIPNPENTTIDRGLTMMDSFRDQVVEGLLSTLNQAGVLNDETGMEDTVPEQGHRRRRSLFPRPSRRRDAKFCSKCGS